MKSFIGGFITGAAIAATWAITHRPSAAEVAAADRAADNLERDATHLTRAMSSVQQRTSALQQAIRDTVPEAEAGINDAITRFKFQTEPRIAKLTASLETITDALPENE